MIIIDFKKKDLDELEKAITDSTIPQKLKRKLMALKMHSLKIENKTIAATLSVSKGSVTNYIKQYKKGGLTETLKDKSYRPQSSLAPFMDCLKCFFLVSPPSTSKEAMAAIEKLTGVKLSEEGVRKNLIKLGMSYRKTGQIPGKADPKRQYFFHKDELEPKLKEASNNKRKVFFVDAAHFVLGSFLGMIWSFKRLLIKGASGRQRYNVLGAVDSQTKELISVRSCDNVNSEKVCELFDELRKRYPDGEISLVLDNASYQRAKLVQEYAKLKDIELIFLPAYSPNLNIIERLWKLVKTHCLRNKYFSDFARFKNSINTFLDELNEKHQLKLESCLTLKFQFFDKPK